MNDKVSGTLRQRGNKWVVYYRLNGKQNTKSLGLDVRNTPERKAKQAMNKLLQQLQEGTYELYNMYFIEYLDWWLNQVKPLIKDSTYEGYYKNVKGKIKPYFDRYKFKLLDLRPMHFTEYFVYLKDKGKSNDKGGLKKKSVMNIRGTLTSALHYAQENGLITENAALMARMPLFDDEPEYEPTIYTAEQIKQLLTYSTATNDKSSLFLHLQIYTGCRKGEILGLTWDNVDFENATINIRFNRTGNKRENYLKLTTPKTKNSLRILPIPPLVVELLKQEKNLQDKNRELLKDAYVEYDYDYVIRQANGRIYNPNSINRIIKRLMDKSDLPKCRPHDFRHFHATALFDYGKTAVSDITRQMGHSSTAVTEKIYVHSDKRVKDDNVKIIQAVLNGAQCENKALSKIRCQETKKQPETQGFKPFQCGGEGGI